MLVVVPTRGRPDSAERLLERFLKTSTTDAQLLFVVDDDDPEASGYSELKHECGAWIESGPRLRLVGSLNAAVMRHVDRYDTVGFMGDDHLPQTYGWDAQLAKAIHDGGPGTIAYGNDLFQGPNLPTAVFMDAAIPRTLGYMAPPTFVHLFIDNCWRAWGERTNKLVYLPDTVIEHLHPQAGKAEWDAGHVEVNSNDMYTVDGAAWQTYRHEPLDADVAKLAAL